jgi:hypothetical protein
MSKKNFEMNRQRKIARGKQRRKIRIGQNRKADILKAEAQQRTAIQYAYFVENEYTWWLAHAVNLTRSDYGNGIWNPLYEIYDGEPTPSLDTIKVHVLETYWDREAKRWKEPAGEMVTALVTQTPDVIFKLRELLVNKLRSGGKSRLDAIAELKQAHNPTAWAYFSDLKKSVMAPAKSNQEAGYTVGSAPGEFETRQTPLPTLTLPTQESPIMSE